MWTIRFTQGASDDGAVFSEGREGRWATGRGKKGIKKWVGEKGGPPGIVNTSSEECSPRWGS